MVQLIQVFALVTGIIYMVLQIFQNKWMWYFDLFTASAACCVALINRTPEGVWAPLWAQVLQNAYFFTMAVIGIYTWRRYSMKTAYGRLHIVRLTLKEALIAVAVILAGIPLAYRLLLLTNDMFPFLDGASMVLSLIAAWFLTKSHLEQWFMWIAADILIIILYSQLHAWWMVALYGCYIASSIVGIIHWRRNGDYIRA